MVEVRLIVEVKDEDGRVGRKYIGTHAPKLDEAITAFLDHAFYNSVTFIRDTLSEAGLESLEYDPPPKKKAAATPKEKAATPRSGRGRKNGSKKDGKGK